MKVEVPPPTNKKIIIELDNDEYTALIGLLSLKFELTATQVRVAKELQISALLRR